MAAIQVEMNVIQASASEPPEGIKLFPSEQEPGAFELVAWSKGARFRVLFSPDEALAAGVGFIQGAQIAVARAKEAARIASAANLVSGSATKQ